MPNNPWARAAGIEDSEDAALRYLRACGRLGDYQPQLCETYVQQGARALQAIQDGTVLSWHHLIEFPDYHAEFDGGLREGRSLEIDPVQLPRAVTDRIRPNPYAAPPVTTVEEHRGGLDAAEIERRQRDNIVVKGVGLIGGLLQTLEAARRPRSYGRPRRAPSHHKRGCHWCACRGPGLRRPGDHRQRRLRARPRPREAFLRGPLLAPASPPTQSW